MRVRRVKLFLLEKCEIKNISKYGKFMLTRAVISTQQLIRSFLVMLHLTVFCLNQLWKTCTNMKIPKTVIHLACSVFSVL